jgi:hypothetical protein
MSNDLSNLDKFIHRVNALREAKVSETTFDVAFLGKVIDELQPSKQVKVKEDVNITIRDGGKFK